MKIIIETIPHLKQRYNTIGDWKWEGDTLHVYVSDMGDPITFDSRFSEMAVGIHEAVEALYCRFDGVSDKDVDSFDMDEKIQAEITELDIEPGDHPSAPYKKQHLFATAIEKMLCVAFHIPWFEYEERIIEMMEEYDNER